MKTSRPAGRARGHITPSWLLPVLFLLVLLQSEAAFSASLMVKVRQLNPAGAVQETTCTDPQNCSLDFSLQTGSKKETLAVRAFYVPGSTLFTFHMPHGYLYAAAKTQADPKNPVYMATWGSGAKTGAATISDITLYGPPVPITIGAKILSERPGPAVADLEVTVEAAP